MNATPMIGAALFVAGATLAASPAWAEDAPADAASAGVEGEAMLAAARDLFAKASLARDRQEWDTCYANAKAAWAVQPHYKIAGVAGDCAYARGDHREAAELLGYFREHRPATVAPELVALLDAHYAEARSHVAMLTVRATAEGAVVEGARLVVGGESAVSGKPLYLVPGLIALEAHHPDYRPATQSIPLTRGEARAIDLHLLPLSSPGGSVVPPERGPDRPTWPLWVSGAALGVGAAGALGFGIGSAVAAGDRDDAATAAREQGVVCTSSGGGGPLCEDYASSDSAQTTLSSLAIISGVVAGLGAAGLAVYTLTGDSAEQTAIVIAPSSIELRATF